MRERAEPEKSAAGIRRDEEGKVYKGDRGKRSWMGRDELVCGR